VQAVAPGLEMTLAMLSRSSTAYTSSALAEIAGKKTDYMLREDWQQLADCVYLDRLWYIDQAYRDIQTIARDRGVAPAEIIVGWYNLEPPTFE
jgi:hypothetical protein